MPLLRTVFVWPPSGHRHRPWQEDPDHDAFVKVSRGVCDRYSEALAGLELRHVVSEVRIGTDEHVPRLAVGEPMRVVYLGDNTRPDGFEMGRIQVAHGFAGWQLRAQQEAVLGAVHEIVTTMAAHRDIESAERLEEARRHVEAHEYGFDWFTPWWGAKRRRKGDERPAFAARCRYVLGPDGFGQVTLDVGIGREDGDPELLGTAGPFEAWTTHESFRRSARQSGWSDPDTFWLIPSVPIVALGDPNAVIRVEEDGAGGWRLSSRTTYERPPSRPTLRQRARAVKLPTDPGERSSLAIRGTVAERLKLVGSADPQMLAVLALDSSAAVRRAVAGWQHTPAESLRILSTDADRQTRTAVAENVSTPEDVMAALLDDTAWQVRWAVLGHSQLPRAVQEAGAAHADPSIRESVALTAGIDRDIAERLVVDPSNSVRSGLAQSTGDPQILVRLARDPVENVRCCAAENDHAGEDLVRLLGSDARANVRSCVAMRRNVPLDVLQKLATDRAVSVRDALAHNQHIPEEILEQLRQDDDPDVARSAEFALRRGSVRGS